MSDGLRRLRSFFPPSQLLLRVCGYASYKWSGSRKLFSLKKLQSRDFNHFSTVEMFHHSYTILQWTPLFWIFQSSASSLEGLVRPLFPHSFLFRMPHRKSLEQTLPSFNFQFLITRIFSKAGYRGKSTFDLALASSGSQISSWIW